MGKLAKRLAIRRSKIGEHARAIVGAATQALAEDDDDSLAPALEDAFESLTPQDLARLLQAVELETELLENGEDVSDFIYHVAVVLSEEVHRHEEDSRTVLFGVPLMLTADRPVSQLPPMPMEVLDELVMHLARHSMLDEDCEVVLLPRLLSPKEADALRLGDIYHLTRALDAEALDEALKVVDDFRGETLPGPPADVVLEVPASSAAVLVGVAIDSFMASPFVLARAVAAEQRDIEQAFERDPQRIADEREAVLEDLRAELRGLSEAMGEAMGVPDLDILAPATDWSVVASRAAEGDRDISALQQLRKLVRLSPDDDNSKLKSLAVLRPEFREGSMAFPVTRQADGKPVGVLLWPELQREDWREAMHRCLHLLTTQGVELGFEDQRLETPGDKGSLH